MASMGENKSSLHLCLHHQGKTNTHFYGEEMADLIKETLMWEHNSVSYMQQISA